MFRSLFCVEVRCVLSSFAIISLGRESWLLYVCCLLDAMWLLLLFTSSSQCQGQSVVCDCGIF